PTNSARAHHIDEIYRFVAGFMKTRTTAAWQKLLTAADIQWTPMNSLDTLIDDPHLAHTGFFRRLDHPSEGAMRTMAVPTRFSESAPELQRHAPRFGEHSRELLREAGYSEFDIERLIADGVTVAA